MQPDYFIKFSVLFTFLSTPYLAQATSPTTLPLDCTAVPAHTDQLCVATTSSPYGPYDDVAIYRKTKDAELILLGSHRGGVGTFGGFGFSKGGRLMWESWAEEGHPYFSFYKTSYYLSEGDGATSLALLNEYEFDHIRYFTDNGKFVYALNEDAFETCPKTAGLPASVIDSYTKSKHCLRYLFIKTGK